MPEDKEARDSQECSVLGHKDRRDQRGSPGEPGARDLPALLATAAILEEPDPLANL